MSVVLKNTKSFAHPVEAELAGVEEVLSAELFSSVRTVAALAGHVREAGGKRLRPMLIALCAKAGGSADPERTVKIAASAEIVHMATLVHDDVIDGSDSRRGRATANACWGNQIAILSGDYMLAKAFALLARDGDVRIMRTLSEATIAMTEGEISQIEAKGDTEALSQQYLSIIRDKTAAFMSACCRMGAILSGRCEEELSRYGMDLGMAFQITDDLLDLVGDPAVTGKPVGGDIREGKITMPVILTLERATSERAELARILHGEASPEDVEHVRRTAETCGAVAETREIAARFTASAKSALSALPPSEAVDSLHQVADFVLGRKN
ncbi:MAG: polyprenyl synthetase family protein [Armatimonadota bacterium]